MAIQATCFVYKPLDLASSAPELLPAMLQARTCLSAQWPRKKRGKVEKKRKNMESLCLFMGFSVVLTGFSLVSLGFHVFLC